MKVVLLYGPPATGKLTLAKEISKKTGYKIFDNHHTMDFLNSIILDKTKAFEPKVSKDFFSLYRKVRVETLKVACKLKDINGLIITEAYTGKRRFIRDMIKIAESRKCKVHLIKLSCDLNQLEKRYTKNLENHTERLRTRKHYMIGLIDLRINLI